jgi:uncharacterized LabA/DUF88 family protein
MNKKNIIFRLYGGWYEQNQISRIAQDLQNIILIDYPCTMSLSDNTKIVVKVELACNQLINPSFHLVSTFRLRSKPSNLKCLPPPVSKCNNQNCPGSVLHDFILNGKCNNTGCTVKLDDLLYRSEQKLVDTMLTTDIIHLSTGQEKLFSIVSSDDDFIPGIKMAIAMGAKIIHIHTKTRGTPIHYNLTETTYREKKM